MRRSQTHALDCGWKCPVRAVRHAYERHTMSSCIGRRVLLGNRYWETSVGLRF
jgi:hypothetical protein